MVEAKPFVGNGGAGDIPAQVFEFLAPMGGTTYRRGVLREQRIRLRNLD
jgi:hypothetical protein